MNDSPLGCRENRQSKAAHCLSINANGIQWFLSCHFEPVLGFLGLGAESDNLGRRGPAFLLRRVCSESCISARCRGRSSAHRDQVGPEAHHLSFGSQCPSGNQLPCLTASKTPCATSAPTWGSEQGYLPIATLGDIQTWGEIPHEGKPVSSRKQRG